MEACFSTGLAKFPKSACLEKFLSVALRKSTLGEKQFRVQLTNLKITFASIREEICACPRSQKSSRGMLQFLASPKQLLCLFKSPFFSPKAWSNSLNQRLSQNKYKHSKHPRRSLTKQTKYLLSWNIKRRQKRPLFNICQNKSNTNSEKTCIIAYPFT